MNTITLKARAKINLGLDVVRKREDGYHEVRMIMQTVNLYDTLVLKKEAAEGISITANVDYIPTNEDNLIYKAAKLLMDEFQITEGLSVELTKRIPVAAGLAGGSTDAAAVMIGVNRIFKLGLSEKELKERAVKIGADVPFCIMGGAALAEGIGEKLTALPTMPHSYLVLAKPPIDVSTKFVYGNLHANELEYHPDIDGQVEALRQQDLSRLVSLCGNVLETVTIPAYPIIEEIKEIMKKNGAENAMMSGSGPTVFGVFTKRHDAEKVVKILKKKHIGKEIYLVRQ